MGTSSSHIVVLKQLTGNAPAHLDPLQAFFAPYTNELILFWISVWITTAGVLVVKVVREYMAHRRSK